jgi:hypothetical protein
MPPDDLLRLFLRFYFRHYFITPAPKVSSAAACISLRFSAASTLLLSLMITASPRPAFCFHSIDAFSFLLRYDTLPLSLCAMAR